jgi:hypothetical protein
VLRVYAHNSIKSATEFVEEVRRRLPMAIQRIQTDHGSEFGTDFTWHLRDLGVIHRQIPRGCPQANGRRRVLPARDLPDARTASSFSGGKVPRDTRKVGFIIFSCPTAVTREPMMARAADLVDAKGLDLHESTANVLSSKAPGCLTKSAYPPPHDPCVGRCAARSVAPCWH